MDEVRIGIIGLGNIGQVHVGNLMDGKVPRGKLTAVGDAIADKLPDYEAKGLKTFDSGEVFSRQVENVNLLFDVKFNFIQAGVADY